MSSTRDDAFCGHCGDRLPDFGAQLGYCPPCAKQFRKVIDLGPKTSSRQTAFQTFTQSCDFTKDPLLATILSAIFPGGGQVYNGHLFKGFLIFVTSPLVVPWVIGIIDAFFSARRHNSKMELDGALPA